MKNFKIFRYFVFAVFLGAPCDLLAERGRHSVDLGFQLGANWSKWFRGEGDAGTNTSTSVRRALFGPTIRAHGYLFNGIRIGVQSGFIYTEKGSRIEFEGQYQGAFELDYLEIPAVLRADIPLYGAFSGYGYAGPRFGFLLKAERIGLNGDRAETDFFDLLDIGISAGIGVSMMSTKTFSISLECGYNHGATNIDDSGENSGLRHKSFFIALGGNWSVWLSNSP